MRSVTLWTTWLLPLSFSPEGFENTQVSPDSAVCSIQPPVTGCSVAHPFPHSPFPTGPLGFRYPSLLSHSPIAYCSREADPPSVPGLGLGQKGRGRG